MYSEGNYLCLTSNGSKKIEIASGNVKIYHYLTVGNGATNPITGATNSGADEKILIVTGNGKTEIGSISSFTENTVDYLVNDVDCTLSNEGKAVAVTYDGSDLVLKAGITGNSYLYFYFIIFKFKYNRIEKNRKKIYFYNLINIKMLYI